MIYSFGFVAGYLLSREEGRCGRPESPLSEHGQGVYTAYWKSAILEFFSNHGSANNLTIQDISDETGNSSIASSTITDQFNVHLKEITFIFQLVFTMEGYWTLIFRIQVSSTWMLLTHSWLWIFYDHQNHPKRFRPLLLIGH